MKHHLIPAASDVEVFPDTTVFDVADLVKCKIAELEAEVS